MNQRAGGRSVSGPIRVSKTLILRPKMKKKPVDQRDWHERRIEEARKKLTAVDRGAPESQASRQSFPERTKRPGSVGLANEARPGLGTRAANPDPAVAP